MSRTSLTPSESLRSDLTKITDNSSCSYEEVIAELKYQLAWWKKAQRDEDNARRAEATR